MMPAQDGSGYGQFGAPRRQGRRSRRKRARSAIVIRSIGTDHHRNPHTGVQYFADGATPIPAGALTVPDAEQLRPHPEARPAGHHAPDPGQPAAAKAASRATSSPKSRAAIPKAPILLVGGHLDSWDQGTGAIDDAAGVAITTAAAKHIMDAGRPLRTIRVVWFGAEEPGGFGGNAYAKAHGADRYAIAGESDFGADRVWRFARKLRRPIRAADAQLDRSARAARHHQERQGRSRRHRRRADDRGRRAVGIAQPGRHALFRLSTTRPTTRSTRSIPSSCGRTSPRGRRCSRCCQAELSRSRNSANGVEPAKQGGNPCALHSPFPLLLLGACQVSKDDNNGTTSVTYNSDVAENAAADVGNTAQNIAADIGNDVKATGDKIDNKVGTTRTSTSTSTRT